MKHDTLIFSSRLVLGLILVVMSLNGIFNFFDTGLMPDGAMAFIGAMLGTGYLWMLLKVVELIVGLALLLNKFTPLASLVLFPVSLNIMLFHLFLAPNAMFLGFIVFLLNIYLLYAYADKYKPMLEG